LPFSNSPLILIVYFVGIHETKNPQAEVDPILWTGIIPN
jgi:hypothetical protein